MPLCKGQDIDGNHVGSVTITKIS